MTPRLSRSAKIAAMALAVFAGLWDCPPVAAETLVTIGTGAVTGVYYPAGGAICRLVNRSRKEDGIHCVVESTGGSINNLEAVHKGDFNLGIVQSDLLYSAVHGTGIFSDAGKDEKLRVLFALHSEPFTLVARKDAHINNFDDLKGKRVDIGAPGSGMRATMEELMVRKGWTKQTFHIVSDKPNELPKALCSGKIDALIYAGGHPNGAIQQITADCDTKLVDVTGPMIDKMVAEHPYYIKTVIPGEMYANNPQDTYTFGVRAVVIASSDMDDDTAYDIVKAVFDNLDSFKTLHPVFATLNIRTMLPTGDVAPIHPGALKYFKEKGLID